MVEEFGATARTHNFQRSNFLLAQIHGTFRMVADLFVESFNGLIFGRILQLVIFFHMTTSQVSDFS